MKDFFDKAKFFHQEGNLQEAKKYYKLTIKANSNNLEAINLLGIVYGTLGEFSESLNYFNKALQKNPTFTDAYYNKGNVLKELKKFQLAIESYDEAIKFNSKHAAAYCNKGTVLNEINLFDEAILNFKKAIEIYPDFAAAYLNWGNALLEKSQFDLALLKYDKVISLNPNFADAYFNRGIIYNKLENYENAIFNFTKAIILNPRYIKAYINLANSFLKIKNIQSAISTYEKLLNIRPDQDFILGKYFHYLMWLGDWKNFDKNKINLKNQIISNKNVIEPFEAHSLINNTKLQSCVAKNYFKFKYPQKNIFVNFPKRNKNKKIKIGYFSADFWEHPVSYLTAELFELHNRDKFEIIGFSYFNKKGSKMRSRLVQSFDKFIDLDNINDHEIAKISREMEIDIAIDLSGETENGRPGAFAYRVAPIQVHYLGFLGSTGSNFYDYMFADKVLIPAELRKFYSEKIIYLPSYQINQKNNELIKKKFTRANLGLPEESFVFCCFNNNYKILPHVFDSWCKILKAVKNSVLFLYSRYEQFEINIKKEAESRGVETSRIIFGNKLSREDYLSRFLNCDLFLDTTPYNAGATASDVLRADLPLLTILGQTFSGRMASSLLTAINIPELITYSLEEYEFKAIDLATNPEKLKYLKEKITKNKLTTLLFDSAKSVQCIENAYIKIFENYYNNSKFEDIEINA